MGEPRHATEGPAGAGRSAGARRKPRPPVPAASRQVDERERPAAGRTALVQLQALAGNAAVAGLLAAPRRSVQRLVGAIPPPPVAPSPPDPAQHAGFRAATDRLAGARQKSRSHPPARKQADAAGRAAKPPADDKESQAKAAKAGDMGAAPVGGFDKAAFIAAVSAAIAKQAPKNLEDADKFADSDKAGAVAAEVKGKVTAGKDASAKPMAEASEKAPDQSRAVEKPVTPLAPPAAPGAPAAIKGKEAMPAKAPAEQTGLGNGPAETDTKMADADVTEEQLAHSNEPEFTGALTAKKEGEEHSATAPAAFRANEAQQITTAQQGAQASGVQGATGMIAVRGTALQQAAGAQRRTQTADEGDRASVTTKVKSIFDATKAAVDGILNGIDPQVDAAFTTGEARAKAAFTAHHKSRMEKYKDDRYSGLLGAGRWIKDKFADLPSEVNVFYVEAKQIYENQMRGVISDIADLVGRELTRAKTRIAEGRTEIATYVNGLDPKLKSLGQRATDDIGAQFEALEGSVDEKSQSLADDLAEKYVTARTAIDDEIKSLQEENKGLWSKAKDAIGGAIETILKLKDMLTGVLARAAGAIGKIIKDPIGFLGNFVGAVKAGVMNFGANILEHLKKGLQSWLFGALAEGGIEIPEKFDLKGIVGLILSLLGLTWASIRARLAKVLPEWVLKALETAVDVVKILSTEGIGGLWTWIVTKISDLKEQVMGQIKDFVITKIITAGITWLISLLNPAAAFIKACKMIYDAVMWFVDNAERMKDFVDSVLDSVESIANGGVGAVASMIESTLAKAIPMVISGLASLLGLGGIAEKIKSILQTIQKPVGKVVDSIIGGVVKYGKKLLGKLKGKGKKEETPEEQQARLEKGVKSGVSVVNKLGKKAIGKKLVGPALAVVRFQHKLEVLEVVEQGKVLAVHGEVQRMTVPTSVKVDDEALEKALLRREATADEKQAAHKALKESSMAPDDPKRAPLAAELATLDGELDTHSTKLDAIKKSKEAPDDEIEKISAWMLTGTEKYEAIRTKISGAGPQKSAAQEKADKYVATAKAVLVDADAAMTEPAIVNGVLGPPGSITLATTPLKKITNARNSLKAAIDAAGKSSVTTEAQAAAIQKQLEGPMSSVGKAIDDGRKSVDPANQVAASVAAVKNVFSKTTEYGNIGDRTAEGAAYHEIATGQPVEGLWHGEKCQSYASNLTTIIATIDLQLAAFPAAHHAELQQAKQQATDRRTKLQAGAAAWYAHQAVTPGFGERQ